MARRPTQAKGPGNRDARTSVWALLVVSSDQQAETLPDQRRWAQECATAHGWRIARTIEGVASGKRGVRPIIRGMVADLEAIERGDRPRHVLLLRVDRIGRMALDVQILVRDLRDLGVSFFTRDQGQVHVDTAMEQMVVSAQAYVAQHENEVRGDKARAVYKRKREAGLVIGNQRAYGLRLEDGRDVPDGDLAGIVAQAFAMRVAGEGYHRIGAHLQTIAPPRAYRNGKEREVRWTPTRVLRLLSNRAYVNGGVIDEVTFARVQRIRDESGPNRLPQRYPWPLSGALTCHCGRRMVGMSCGNPARRIRYYACRATWQHDGRVRLARADALEAAFVALLRRLRAEPAQVEAYRRRAVTVPAKTLEAETRKVRAHLAAIAKKRDATWELHAAGRVRAEDVQERLDALAEQRVDLEQRIERLQEQIAVGAAATRRDLDMEALFARAADLFARGETEEQRRIARAVAIELGGLCVERDGALAVRRVERKDQRRRHASGN